MTSTRAGNARGKWTFPELLARTLRPCCWTSRVIRGWKKGQEKKVNWVLIQSVFNAFDCSVLLLMFLAYNSVPVVYSVWKNSPGAAELGWRAIDLGMEVSFLDKQNIFYLFILLILVVCISSPFDRVPASSFSFVLYETSSSMLWLSVPPRSYLSGPHPRYLSIFAIMIK